ncbi:IS1595 family transposase [Pseudoduganella chitinolytica]|uniref:IS1595 family transposase n=1 Tax=Pseudoduganella chitinolytica TaxID=34070 RepID=A0ABY8BC01_9BURK|nr:IS1595 family transposase [Pseudoduganella chitinolytica]WEF33435.1 IS1595 family transposase [Pseudoduganella chitinolytica]
MDSQQFQTLQAQVRQWLVQLTGKQVHELRDTFDRCTSLADCLAIIEARGTRTRCCPHCQGERLYRHGVFYGLQRYRCRQCGASFNALTGTPLAFIRLREKWLPFLQCRLNSMTVRGAAQAIGIHRNTSFRWRHRFLTMAKDARALPLAGIVEADETYLLESQKGSRKLTRPARRRGGTASHCGPGKDHDCILVACDRSGKASDFVTGRGPVTAQQLQERLPPVLAPGMLLVTDGALAYKTFAKAARVEHRAVNVAAGVRVVDDVLHVQTVNSYHGRFKSWLRRFNGVASKYLPNYLGWRYALDAGRVPTPQQLLRAALFLIVI